MTLRRLNVLVTNLPYDAPLWAELRADEEKTATPTPDRIRQRRAEWEARNRTKEG